MLDGLAVVAKIRRRVLCVVRRAPGPSCELGGSSLHSRRVGGCVWPASKVLAFPRALICFDCFDLRF